ncbi:hypothetical protein [Streptomyces virginiae]|uniref:hypothetical protein n=1 Tax=Streptomyces virginiae TaxID=1961 RepID=UPI003864765F
MAFTVEGRATGEARRVGLACSDRRDYVRDNGSDTATLRDDRGRTIDTETWGRPR